ncbi:hypothetical protein F511_07943 [Dorcoceras hygrometricum]|uniref:Uncharacterized protein n=1 Tax=Dorcoceras hygrometricum TaxID=472368 RepID=A0A2Z7CFK5_9LAMI|nr:hypothetical protein F511_07943 [Dorcoceras hygrometricum]
MSLSSTSWVLDTGCGSHICNDLQVMTRSRRLREGETRLVTQLRLMCSYEVVDPSEVEEGEISVSGALFIVNVQEQRAIAAQVCIGSAQNFQWLSKQHLLIFLILTKRTNKWYQSRCYLEIAIAKRCRLHKLIRQRFALALKIQQMLFAMKKISRYFSQQKPAGSNSTSRHARKEEVAKRFIQSQDNVPVASYSALHPVDKDISRR